MNTIQYHTVILSALLHDIGKFIHRASEEPLRTALSHKKGTKVFLEKELAPKLSGICDIELLTNLAFYHHDEDLNSAPPHIRPLATLISCADTYSSRERARDRASYDYRTASLHPIFSAIYRQKPETNFTYRPHPLSDFVSKPFPVEQGDHTLDHLLRDFGKEFSQTSEVIRDLSFDSLLAFLLTIFQKYLWCVPSDTQKDFRDISLYDHLSTTSAISACLYQYHHHRGELADPQRIKSDNEEKFTLLAGDISGIQNFILDVSARGASRSLRARSFYLSLLSETIAHHILYSFNLPLTNLLSSSGGNFFILLPSLPDSEEKLDRIRAEFDQWTRSKFFAALTVSLATQPFKPSAFTNMTCVISSVRRKLDLHKNRPLRSQLISDRWNEDAFLFDTIEAGDDGICTSCSHAPAQRVDDERLCESCNRFRIIGRQLTDASFIALYRSRQGEYPLPFEYSFSLLEKGREPQGSPYLALSLTGPASPLKTHPTYFRYLANYVPRAEEDQCDNCPATDSCQEAQKPKERDILPFNCIAQRSTGWSLLACLKADVDNLGKLLREGFKSGSLPLTISRFAQFSRMLDLFFSGYVHHLLCTQYPFIYTVFSGGDDLLLIGPWDHIIDFSLDLRRAFTCFAAHNPFLTFSAGIYHSKPHSRAATLVQCATEYLHRSKKNEDKAQGETENKYETHILRKDRMTLLETTFTFTRRYREDEPSVELFLESAKKVSGWLREGLVTRGLVWRFLNYAIMFQKWQETNDTRYLRFIPLITYDIQRNIPDDEERKEVLEWAESLNKNIDSPELKMLRALCTYALISVRGKEQKSAQQKEV